MTSRVRVLAAMLLAVLAAACGSSGPATAPSTSTTAASTATIPSGATYVALGSSYAAGIGIPKQEASCGRSDHNYPHILARDLELELVDRSCSGATTSNVIDTPQGDEPPQIGGVTQDTALITVTVGGNDVGYIGTALGCGDAAKTCSVDKEKLDADFTSLARSLRTMVQELRSKAPHATIVLVTYPRLVPAANCPALSFDPAEATLMRDIGERLHAAFLSLVEDTHIKVADPYAADADHSPCAPAADRWVEGKDAVDAFAYHPNATGHAAMARMVKAVLRS